MLRAAADLDSAGMPQHRRPSQDCARRLSRAFQRASLLGLFVLSGCGRLIGVDNLTYDRQSPRADEVRVVTAAGQEFFIDKYEVTVRQYMAWVQQGTPTPAEQDPDCQWNTEFVEKVASNGCEPGTPDPSDYDNPMRCVDFCDATAYCEAHGKHLCGRIGGGALAQSEFAKASVDEWYDACSAGGTRTYPYGNTFDPTKCNGHDSGNSVLPVVPGKMTGCEGGYPGIFDMSGNVDEWVNACTPTGGSPQNDVCVRAGGAFYQYQQDLQCSSEVPANRNDLSNTTGIRCCR